MADDRDPWALPPAVDRDLPIGDQVPSVIRQAIAADLRALKRASAERAANRAALEAGYEGTRLQTPPARGYERAAKAGLPHPRYALRAHPLDVLEARGHISPSQYEAGARLLHTIELAGGAGLVPDPQRVGSGKCGGPSVEALDAARDFRRAQVQLWRAGRDPFLVTIGVVVHRLWLAQVCAAVKIRPQRAARAQLIAGLDALADLWGWRSSPRAQIWRTGVADGVSAFGATAEWSGREGVLTVPARARRRAHSPA